MNTAATTVKLDSTKNQHSERRRQAYLENMRTKYNLLSKFKFTQYRNDVVQPLLYDTNTNFEIKKNATSLDLKNQLTLPLNKKLTFSKYFANKTHANENSHKPTSLNLNIAMDKELLLTTPYQDISFVIGELDMNKLRSFKKYAKIDIKPNDFLGSSRIENEPDRVLRRRVYSKNKNRFKRIAKVILVFLKYFVYHQKELIDKLYSKYKDRMEEKTLFDKDVFSRPREQALTNEAKIFLNLEPNERNDRVIKHILFSLNFSVPEFSEYPIHNQKTMAMYGFYEEFQPGRVIIRQRHLAEKYYFIISGSADCLVANRDENDEIILTPTAILKRGDGFGDMEIINKLTRQTTVINNGPKQLCLLSFYKEDFYKISSLAMNKEEKFDFLRRRVDIFCKFDYPFSRINDICEDYISLFYRKNYLICENPISDDWLYVIKSGSAKVLKKVKLSFDNYIEIKKSKHVSNLGYIEAYFEYYIEKEKKFEKILRSEIERHFFIREEDKQKYAYFQIDRLFEGRIFGLQELVKKEEDDVEYESISSSLLLVSEGCECILINRRTFVKLLPSMTYLELRTFVQSYPDDAYMKEKYFDAFKWINSKEELILDKQREAKKLSIIRNISKAKNRNI